MLCVFSGFFEHTAYQDTQHIQPFSRVGIRPHRSKNMAHKADSLLSLCYIVKLCSPKFSSLIAWSSNV